MDMAVWSVNTFIVWCWLLGDFVTGKADITLDTSRAQHQHGFQEMFRNQHDFPYEDESFFTFGDMAQIVGGNMTPPFVVSDTCKAYLLAYSSNASDFVHCAVKYARPFRFCGSCVVPYTRAVNLYCDIVKVRIAARMLIVTRHGNFWCLLGAELILRSPCFPPGSSWFLPTVYYSGFLHM